METNSGSPQHTRIAVAGGTGLVGTMVAEEASARGHEVVVLSRASGVDLTSAAGLAARLAGAAVVVDVTDTPTQSRRRAEAFFGQVTQHLLAAEEQAGVAHHVALSIVGVDDVGLGYYAGKRRQEELVRAGRVPWTVLRATQFHEFAAQALGFARIGPLTLVPRMLSRPVAAVEVAAHLVDLAERGPAGMAPELAGPREEQVVDMARRYAAARGQGGHVVGLRVPGGAGRALRGGALLPRADGPRGTLDFSTWLAQV